MVTVNLEHAESVCVGVDIGQSVDHSAIAVVARVLTSEAQEWAAMPLYVVPYLRRFPLGTPFHQIEEEVAALWGSDYLRYTSNSIVVDKTGVGAPVVESMRRNHCLPVNAVLITSGDHEAYHPESDSFHVPKSHLVTGLQQLVQRRRFQTLEDVESRADFFNELADFSYKIDRNSGRVSYEAATERTHDDLVVATALAVWFLQSQRPVPDVLSRGNDDVRWDPLARQNA